MSDKILYLIQSEYHHTDQILNQLLQLYTDQDHVVLTGDSVLFVDDLRLQDKQNLYVLKNDAEILVQALPAHIQSISYAQFADLVLDFRRCVSLK